MSVETIPDADFPEYGLKLSKDAATDRSDLDLTLIPTLDSILRQLTTEPKQYPDRLSPASRDGKNFVYSHPDPHIQVTFEIAEDEKNIYVFSIAAAEFKPKKTIFMSYSHEDEEWLRLLKKFLTVLEQQGIIEFWDDTKIEPAADWKAEIQKALDSSKAALLLVSQDFLISDFIGKYELPQLLAEAESKGKKIYWIPVRESTVFDSHKNITRFQSLLKDPRTPLAALPEPEREKILVQVSRELGQLA